MLRPVNHRIWLQRYRVNELVEIVEWATLKWQQMDALKLQRNAIDVAGSRQFCNLNVEIGLSAPEWFPLPHQWQLEGKWGRGRWRGRQLYFRGKGGDWWITKRVGNINLKKGTCEKKIIMARQPSMFCIGFMSCAPNPRQTHVKQGTQNSIDGRL